VLLSTANAHTRWSTPTWCASDISTYVCLVSRTLCLLCAGTGLVTRIGVWLVSIVEPQRRCDNEGVNVEQRAARWIDRAGGMAGIAFVLLISASWFVAASEFEDSDQTAHAIARDLANRVDVIETGVALATLAAIAGFWFVGSLHLRLTAGGPSTAAWAAFGGGVAMVTLILAGSAISSAALVGSLAGDPQVAKTLWVLEEGFRVWFGAPLIVFMLGVSIVSINRGDPPRWLGWSGVVATVVAVVNSVLDPRVTLALLVFLWVLALAVTMTIRPQPRLEPERVDFVAEPGD
jgi:hypothetical protein